MKTKPRNPRSVLECGSPLPLSHQDQASLRAALAALTARIEDQTAILVTLPGDDDRLICAGHWIARIGEKAMPPEPGRPIGLQITSTFAEAPVVKILLKHNLASLAAFCLLWATPGEKTLDRGCRAIARARERQQQLFSLGYHPFDCASPIVDPRRKFRVLAGEFGEVAQALDQIENHGRARGNLHAELIQCAAMCVAWIQSLE